MDRGIEELRARIVDGQRRGVRQHPSEVRAAAAELAARAQRRGVSLWSTAQHLGVGMQTLQRWMASPIPRLRPVRVIDREAAQRASPAGAIVHLPGGMRIEGLSTEELVAFVRALS